MSKQAHDSKHKLDANFNNVYYTCIRLFKIRKFNHWSLTSYKL